MDNGLGVFPAPVTAAFWPAERAVAKASFAVDMENLPSCAVHSLGGDCDASNATCVCAHETVMEREYTSTMESCTFPEALYARNLTETSCNIPFRDDSAQLNILNIAMASVTSVVVGIRVVFKRFCNTRQRLSVDDWIIAVALVLFGFPSILIMIFGLTANGLGKDIWSLQPPGVALFALYFYVMEILYITLMTLIKLTLSFFYLDIFCGNVIRRLLWGTIAFHISFGIAFVVKVIFQCSPISFYWAQFDTSDASRGHCIDGNASGWANAAIGVAVDFWLIGIPISQLRKLKLHWRKKVGAALMFLTGALVTMVSCLRLHSIIHFADSTNPTWEQSNIVWWSTIEVNVGIICTCLPSMRLVLMHLCPRTFGNDSRVREIAGSGHGERQRTDPDFIDEEHDLGGEDGGSTTQIVKIPVEAVVARMAEQHEETRREVQTKGWYGRDGSDYTLPTELSRKY